MFARPGITALRDQAISDMLVSTGLPTLLRRSPLRALAYSQAGLAYGQYGYLDWIARQSTPFTATGVFLEAWAALVNIQRKPSSEAKGVASFIGNAGATVPVKTVLRRANGTEYVTQGATTLVGSGTGSVAVKAAVAGSSGSLNSSTPLTLIAPLAGVRSDASGDPATPGTDPELDAPFRTRMLLRWAEPPQGGSRTDYQTWALAVPGVTRVWVLPLGMGPGTVVLYTMFDVAETARGGFPQGAAGVASGDGRDAPATGDLLAVADYVYPLQPVTALIYSVAPIPYPVPFAITTPRPVPAVTQAAAQAALVAQFLALADALGGTLPIGPFDDALAKALGTTLFTVTAPTVAIQAPVGHLPILGAVTWSVTGA